MTAVYFGGALIISLVVNVFLILLSSFKPQNRKILKRFGGVGIVVAFVVVVLSVDVLEKTTQISALLFGSFAILIFGVVDDIKNCSWKKQLVFQIFLAMLLIFSGYSIQYITGPFGEMIRLDFFQLTLPGLSWNVLGSLAVALWVILIINALNWADGIDGLAGTIGIIGTGAIVFVSLLPHVNQPAVVIIGTVFVGSIFGFLWHNFPPARIEAGSSGSYVIGFVVAGLAIIAGTKIATAMVVLAIPLVDSAWVICERFFQKVPITKKDKRHLHYKLRARGWSDAKMVGVYSLFILSMLGLSFFVPTRSLRLGTVFFEIGLIIFFLWYLSVNEFKNKTIKK